MTKTYIPRNDCVLLRLEHADLSKGGVVIPEKSSEGWKWSVVAIGPKVEDLEVGNRVEVCGEVGKEIARLPGDEKLYVVREMYIILVVREEK